MPTKQDILIQTLADDFGLDKGEIIKAQSETEELISTHLKSVSIKEIKELCILSANDNELGGILCAFINDERTGVQGIIKRHLSAISKRYQEKKRVHGLYSRQDELANGKLCMGLDEVGRGPLAGPLTIAAVVCDPNEEEIEGINDSKKLSSKKREELSKKIKNSVLAYSIQHVEPEYIDKHGMTESLRCAFVRGIKDIDEQLKAKGMSAVEVILLDGNAMHLDPREINVIKGDATCASISSASIIAKTERDELMSELAKQYSEYGWEKNAGYGSAEHIGAIRKHGLSPYHRKSFCKNFVDNC